MKSIDLILGDSRKELPKLLDASIDCIVTDPPYGHNNNDGDLIHLREKALGKSTKHKKGNSRPIANDGPEANQLLKKLLPEFKRLLSAGGSCCCCGGGPDPQFARWSLWLDEVLSFKQMIVWDKGPMGMGWHYRRSYETVLIATKTDGKCRWFDKTETVENIIRPGMYGIKKIIPDEEDHPTPKPVELAIHFLRLHTKEGDTVLDPFMGAGWVAEACVLMNRKFVGIEIDPHWHEVAKKRVNKAKNSLGFGLIQNQIPVYKPKDFWEN